MFDIEKIQRLIEMMVENDLVEVSLRSGTEEINLRRPNASAAVAMAPVAVARPPAEHLPSPAAPVASGPAAPPKEDAGLVSIASPMVGTFYVSASPDSPPFVKVGDRVGPESVVCILEAMKVFNEIKAETSGTIERILVKNGQAVEYGQPMFQVRPG